jgi:hypothetical protein
MSFTTINLGALNLSYCVVLLIIWPKHCCPCHQGQRWIEEKTSSISRCHTTNHCRNHPDMCLNSNPETYSLNILPLCPLPYIWVCRLCKLLIVLLFLYFLSSLSQRVVGFRAAHSKKIFPCKYRTKILFKEKW